MSNLQSAADARGFLTWVTQVPALKGRPTVKRRDAAAKQAFVFTNYEQSTRRILFQIPSPRYTPFDLAVLAKSSLASNLKR
ncbi:MAG: hypothetical protein DMG05_21680 [Acidobacteria bacterium]|nr:MAG: hypothetical protein DMG05_21680 [Acidobacteriota bacterium]